MFPSHGYDFVQWSPSKRKLFESNYLKANSPDGRRAFWFKHNILAPADRKHPAVLELWCVLFDRDAGPPRAVKQTVHMDQLIVAKTNLRIEGENILLTDRETRTTVRQEDGKKASWNITYESRADGLYMFPNNYLYTGPFPKKKILTHAPRCIFNGSLEFEGETIDVVDWVGIRSHNWGSEHAFSYAYGNCNLFGEDESALIDLASAKLKLGPIITPWMSVGVLRHGDQQYDFNAPHRWITRKAVIDFPRCEVKLVSKRGELRTKWHLDPQQTVCLRYLHPNGTVSYCYNSKFAHVEVQHGNRVLTSDSALLEFLFNEPIPGIPIHGDAELPE